MVYKIKFEKLILNYAFYDTLPNLRSANFAPILIHYIHYCSRRLIFDLRIHIRYDHSDALFLSHPNRERNHCEH